MCSTRRARASSENDAIAVLQNARLSRRRPSGTPGLGRPPNHVTTPIRSQQLGRRRRRDHAQRVHRSRSRRKVVDCTKTSAICRLRPERLTDRRVTASSSSRHSPSDGRRQRTGLATGSPANQTSGDSPNEITIRRRLGTESQAGPRCAETRRSNRQQVLTRPAFFTPGGKTVVVTLTVPFTEGRRSMGTVPALRRRDRSRWTSVIQIQVVQGQPVLMPDVRGGFWDRRRKPNLAQRTTAWTGQLDPGARCARTAARDQRVGLRVQRLGTPVKTSTARSR